jgi:RNA polymerase sigma factor (sigma-70 family)
MPSPIVAVLRYLCHVGGATACAERSDAWLLQQFVARRDEDAFAAILERHGPLVWAVCRRVLPQTADAEDAFQATFLVLARKAGSVRRLEALAAWLHRVALNIARTARTAHVRRQAHERQAAVMSEATPVDEALLRDWQPLLHEEVDRLPQKYRAPVILCYFQGMTHDAAARQLRWPIGTVKGRLARARDLLRTRLARRGLTLTSAGLAAALATEASAAVPPALLGLTLHATVVFMAGGAVSAGALTLAKGALQTMTATKLMLVLLVLSTVGLLGGGLFALGGSARKDPGGDDSGPRVVGLVAPVAPPKVEDQNVVEKDGVRFELLVPQREWQIPEDRPGARTTVKLALRITNRTNNPLRFTRFDSLSVWMVGPDGKELTRSGGRDGTFPVQEADCPLVKPGDSVTFDLDAHLFRQDGKLRFGGSDGFGGGWGFADEFKPGRYQLRIWYSNTATEQEVGRAVRTVLKGLWTGEVKTPFVEVTLTAAVALAAPVAPKAAPAAAEFGPEVKGLRAMVTLARPKFAVEEAIEVKYVVKNVSTEVQTLWHSGFWANHLVLVKDAAGNEPPLTESGKERRRAFSPGGERTKNVPVKVPPGGEDAAYEPYDLTRLYDLSRPGRYTVQYVYEEKQGGWEGRLPSNEAAFEVTAKASGKNAAEKDGLAESEAVRVEGLEFVAFIPKRIPVPVAGPRDVALGMRITNVSDKPLTISVIDVINLWVFNTVDGTKLGAAGGRDGKPRPLPPVTLAPGASWTWQPRATLDRTTDRATLRLNGPDGRGFPGFWEISTLKVGTHRLSIAYDNSNARQGDVPLWVGKATTREVEFEIAENREPGERPAAKPTEDAAKADLEKLQGTWRLVAVEEAGKPLPPANFGRNTHWDFSGITGKFTSGMRVMSGTVTLDPTKDPKWIDLTLGKDFVLQGIYELKGDTLRVFLLPTGTGRPSEFKTREGTTQTMSTYERAKTDP